MEAPIKTKILLIVILLEIAAIGYFCFYPQSFKIESEVKLFINPHKIIFYFNQPIIRSSFEKNFQIEPYAEGNFDWDSRNRQVIFKPYYLTYDKEYTVSVKNIRSYIFTELKEKIIKFKIESPSSVNLASLMAINPIKLPISEKNVFAKPNGETVVISPPRMEKVLVPVEPDGKIAATDQPPIIQQVIIKEKYIDVDISDQIMTLYQNGQIDAVYEVSTGRYGMPTPLGEFKIFSKEENHWSRTYKLYMPFSMQFASGFYIHELPYWPNGYREGIDHLGTRVSHGCIRLGIGAAGEVYNFADLGTPVVIHQ